MSEDRGISPGNSPGEPVRLVIWDLDETLWQGTLTEGAISPLAQTRAIVTELARRGIVSSICSKNDPAQARACLEKEGLWEHFVFASIGWEAKGPRIRALIEDIQLRPATVLFIDDNPSNLEEARHFTPELQIAGIELLPQLLEDPRFAGKPDVELTRLGQYKALEQRKSAAASAAGGVEEFLRGSRIQVTIHYELDEHVDRIIELINRTQQLNFTKRKLPEDLQQAREVLKHQLHSHEIQAGLLHVEDRYGDHGFAGFYMLHNSNELLHFCFSCRILGMGVEAWLYRQLGRPRLANAAQVPSHRVDWINNSQAVQSLSSQHRVFDWVAARGGCDMQALTHYFRAASDQVLGEFNVGRRGFDARVDHSMFLRYAVEAISPEAIAEAAKLGYRQEDFRTALNQPRTGTGLAILSFWADAAYALYQHRKLGFKVPFALSGRANHLLDARDAALEDLPEEMRGGWIVGALQTLQTDYDYLGMIDESLFKENLRLILAALPKKQPVVLIEANSKLRDLRQGVTHTSSNVMKFNRWIDEATGSCDNVKVVSIRDVISSEDQVQDWSHFDRIVYHKLYKRILSLTHA